MKNFLVVFIALLGFATLTAQSKPVKVVFDVTSNDENTQRSALRHLKMMNEAYPESEFELVIYGKAVPMIIKKDSPFAEQVKAFTGKENVAIKVCEVSMQRFKVEKTDLFPVVETVPDAIMEIVSKQSEGWGYIKESHN